MIYHPPVELPVAVTAFCTNPATSKKFYLRCAHFSQSSLSPWFHCMFSHQSAMHRPFSSGMVSVVRCSALKTSRRHAEAIEPLQCGQFTSSFYSRTATTSRKVLEWHTWIYLAVFLQTCNFQAMYLLHCIFLGSRMSYYWNGNDRLRFFLPFLSVS